MKWTTPTTGQKENKLGKRSLWITSLGLHPGFFCSNRNGVSSEKVQHTWDFFIYFFINECVRFCAVVILCKQNLDYMRVKQIHTNW